MLNDNSVEYPVQRQHSRLARVQIREQGKADFEYIYCYFIFNQLFYLKNAFQSKTDYRDSSQSLSLQRCDGAIS